MKKISICIALGISFLLGSALTACHGAVAAEQAVDYSAYADTLDLIEIIDAEDLTADEVQNRNGKLIIERVIGQVDNAETGDGHILYEDSYYNYISYKGVDGISTGDVICTFLIYNPDNNYEDDFIMIFDYIIDDSYTSDMDYYAYADSLDLIEIINGEDLPAEVLQDRNGKLIIERVIGIVDDVETGDGHTLNKDPNCQYICYKRVPGISVGTIVCTYYIYNPDTNYEDDIMMRFDYIIDSCAVEN